MENLKKKKKSTKIIFGKHGNLRQEVLQYERPLLPFQNTKMLLSVIQWRRKVRFGREANGRRRGRLLPHAQHEGPPRAREERVLDTSRIILVSEKLQAFYVRGNHEERCRLFFGLKDNIQWNLFVWMVFT